MSFDNYIRETNTIKNNVIPDIYIDKSQTKLFNFIYYTYSNYDDFNNIKNKI
jgi:hypothetical protein